jgi:hypothetical protein
MIDRNRNFRRLVVIAGLALWGLLGLGTGSARAQFQDNLPCSSRTNKDSCFAECTNVNFLLECTCLWDFFDDVNQSVICPPDRPTCCLNMPCEKWDFTSEVECLRGGGSPDGIMPKNCGWNVQPTGGGLCRCVPPLVRADYTLEDLSVMDPNRDYSQGPYDCRCPFTTDEQWLRLGVCNPPGVSKLAVKLNFAKPLHDSIGLKGTLAVPDGFAVAGATLDVSIGGVVRTFTLDAKGKAEVGTDKAHLAVKAKKGVVLAQDAKLSIKFSKGSFASSLSDEGLVNATVADVAVSVPVEIKLNDTMYAKTQPQTYTAKAGKTGSAKVPK